MKKRQRSDIVKDMNNVIWSLTGHALDMNKGIIKNQYFRKAVIGNTKSDIKTLKSILGEYEKSFKKTP